MARFCFTDIDLSSSEDGDSSSDSRESPRFSSSDHLPRASSDPVTVNIYNTQNVYQPTNVTNTTQPAYPPPAYSSEPSQTETKMEELDGDGGSIHRRGNGGFNEWCRTKWGADWWRENKAWRQSHAKEMIRQGIPPTPVSEEQKPSAIEDPPSPSYSVDTETLIRRAEDDIDTFVSRVEEAAVEEGGLDEEAPVEGGEDGDDIGQLVEGLQSMSFEGGFVRGPASDELINALKAASVTLGCTRKQIAVKDAKKGYYGRISSVGPIVGRKTFHTSSLKFQNYEEHLSLIEQFKIEIEKYDQASIVPDHRYNNFVTSCFSKGEDLVKTEGIGEEAGGIDMCKVEWVQLEGIYELLTHKDPGDLSHSALVLWQHPDTPQIHQASWYEETDGTKANATRTFFTGGHFRIFNGKTTHGVIPPPETNFDFPWYASSLVLKVQNPEPKPEWMTSDDPYNHPSPAKLAAARNTKAFGEHPKHKQYLKELEKMKVSELREAVEEHLGIESTDPKIVKADLIEELMLFIIGPDDDEQIEEALKVVLAFKKEKE